MTFRRRLAQAFALTLATLPLAIAPPVDAHPSPVGIHRAPLASARAVTPQIQVQMSRPLQQQAVPFRPLVLPRKPEAQPNPASSPDLFSNPLKRRRMAMPGAPDVELGF